MKTILSLSNSASPEDGLDGAFPVTVNGDLQQQKGMSGVIEVMEQFMYNPDFKGATRGKFRGDTNVELRLDAAGNTRVVVVGYDLLTLDADDTSAACEMLELVRSSDVGDALPGKGTISPSRDHLCLISL